MAEHPTILEPDKIYDLYAIPFFGEEQQILFFDLSEEEMQKILSYRTLFAKLYFVLQLGYFKARQQFFIFDLSKQPRGKPRGIVHMNASFQFIQILYLLFVTSSHK